MARAYDRGVDRQQDADRLVYDEGDLRRVLSEAARNQTVATIRLAGDIVLSRPLVLSYASYKTVVDGAGRYAIRTAAGWTHRYMFDVGDKAVSDLSFVNVGFGGVAGFTNIVDQLIRADSAAATLTRVDFHGCRFDWISALFRAVAGDPSWSDSVVEDCFLFGQNSMLTANLGSCVYTRCLLSRVYRQASPALPVPINCTNAAGSTRNVFLDVSPSTFTGDDVIIPAGGMIQAQSFRRLTSTQTLSGAAPTLDLFSTTDIVALTLDATTSGSIGVFGVGTSGRIRVVQCVANAGTASLVASASLVLTQGPWKPNANDTLTLLDDGTRYVELSRSGGQPLAAPLNSANPTLDTLGASVVKYSVGAGGTGNIFLANGAYDGQQVVLWCSSYAGTAIFNDSTALSNCRLVGNFTPTVRATLTLMWEASDDSWQEVCRANT